MIRSMRISMQTKILGLLIFMLFVCLVCSSWMGSHLAVQDKTAYIYDHSYLQLKSVADSIDERIRELSESNRILGDQLKADSLGSLTQERLKARYPHGLLILRPVDDERFRTQIEVAASGPSSPSMQTLIAPLGWTPRTFQNGELRIGSLPESSPQKGKVVIGTRFLDAADRPAVAVTLLDLEQEMRSELDGDAEIHVIATADNDEKARGRTIASTPDFDTRFDAKELARFEAPLLDQQHTALAAGARDWERPNGTYISNYQKLKHAPLVVVGYIPKSVAFESATALIQRSIVLGISILLIAIAIATVVVRRMTRRLREMWEATRRISEGDFSIELPIVRNGDEINDLGSSINLMAQRISELLKETADKARMEKELETAKLVQDTMFPPESINTGNLQIRSYYRPASECGGDWWGMIDLPGDRVLLAIGDATGHGVPSAMVTATAKATCSTLHGIFRTMPSIAVTPGMVLEFLNKAIFESANGRIQMTFFVAIIDQRSGEIEYATASHDTVYRCKVAQKDAQQVELMALEAEPGPRLGQQAEASYATGKAKLSPDDLIVFYTDGITEGFNPEAKQYGDGKFARSVKKHAARSIDDFRSNVLEDFTKFTSGEPLHDDVTLVACRWNPRKAA